MAEGGPICRLCLSFEKNELSDLEACNIGKLKAVIPELDMKFPNKSSICLKCMDSLEKCFELKRTLSKNNDLIQKEKDKLDSQQFDLNTCFSKDGMKAGGNICRICLENNEGPYIYLNEDNGDFNNIVEYCLPELDPSLSVAPVICAPCQETVHKLNDFKRECSSVEEKIQSYVGSNPSEDVDLKKVVAWCKIEDENDFLSGFEVQDEEGTDIFDNIPNTSEESRKHQLSQSVKEEVPAKKIKLTADEIIDEELPHFRFDGKLLYNPSMAEAAVEDWIFTVEEYKKKFGWSDYTTIHKVLVHLKGLKDLYVWFSNIADIMNWDQWKKKLLAAFPRKDDYHILAKKMITRKKQRTETYLSYYTEKLRLMEPLNLTQQQQVSCIFGGITSVIVCCVGRVGDYHTTEELLDYFKSCDDKEKVQAAAEANPNNRFNQLAQNPAAAHHFAAPDPNKPKEKNKNKRKRCYKCNGMDHTAAECRKEPVPAQNRPHLSQANEKPKRMRMRVNKKCRLCGLVGHKADNCKNRVNVNVQLTNSPPMLPPHQQLQLRQQQQQRQLPKVAPKKAKQNMPDWVKKMHPFQNPKQNRNEDYELSRCRDCGRFGSRANPCCQVQASRNGAYIGSYANQGINNKQICLRCYQSGHSTKDCSLHFYRNNRN